LPSKSQSMPSKPAKPSDAFATTCVFQLWKTSNHTDPLKLVLGWALFHPPTDIMCVVVKPCAVKFAATRATHPTSGPEEMAAVPLTTCRLAKLHIITFTPSRATSIICPLHWFQFP
jgi:hypothetical protein